MTDISGAKADEVIEFYSKNHSIIKTAQAAGISTVKTRKILITAGLWESETSLQIGELLTQGYTSQEIADRLYMSVKNVQAYMPYARGIYDTEEHSSQAERSGKYRMRMKQAAFAQTQKKEELNSLRKEESTDGTVESDRENSQAGCDPAASGTGFEQNRQ